MRSYIVVKNNASLIHRYKDAPLEVAFLRDYHRHILFIETTIEVYHDDRELEFVMVKNKIADLLENNIARYEVDKSCEMIAKELIELLLAAYGDRNIVCKVFEDNENGAIVTYQGEDEEE